MREDVKNHWNDLSVVNGPSYKASWSDYFMLQKELDEIYPYLYDGCTICDVGCNNGYCDLALLEKNKNINIVGLDYSEKAIEQANKAIENYAYKDRLSFFVGNILDINSYPKEVFDLVIVKRTLINLETHEEQITAINNLRTLLRPDGTLLIMEAVDQNLQRLNALREEFGLDALDTPWHNVYINQEVIDHIYKTFKVIDCQNFASTYYVCSRVLYPWVKKNKDLSYINEINRLASFLPNIGDYGIQQLFVLKNL